MMKLSYMDVLGDGARYTIEAEITTDDPLSSYNQPIIRLADGKPLDAQSWILLNYQIEQATESEFDLLRRWISLFLFLASDGLINDMIIRDAVAYVERQGYKISNRSLRLAAANNRIPGAHRLGRDWMIPQAGLDHYLANHPRLSRK